MISSTPRQKLAEGLATVMGAALGQTYERHDGGWWLFTAGKPVRALADDEVKWHVHRRHKPFVPDGVSKDHPDWWKDPA